MTEKTRFLRPKLCCMSHSFTPESNKTTYKSRQFLCTATIEIATCFPPFWESEHRKSLRKLSPSKNQLSRR